ncbi:MAG: DPP IV N-terminal domain-containing protein [Chloroflexi bacterium]|nr:DPP IV N-terminal domain-containing protein [Chloroflexota bacterium]MCY3686268.1 DPP IV N-terminal domain-containing protein [Chloroflexota bacterium]MDE2708889.1 DPP IV N-terminal domain-containing protein [Chloroflexota bacterium]
MAERLTISDVATYPRPGMDAPGMVGFTPDSSAVTWLHAGEGGLVRSLWRIEIESGERSVIAGPGADAPMSREEELLRERTRTRELGVSSYSWARESEVPLLMIPGPTVRISVDGASLGELPGSEGALTPTLSPDGTQLSFVRGGELLVMGVDGQSKPRQLTSGAEDGLTHGLADYIAQEEFGQLRGHWWSRDGRIAYLRVDERHVAPYPIVHQGGTEVDVETHRYPFAGDENAHVSLWVLNVESGDARELPLPDEDGYLVRVAWWPDGAGGQRLVAQWIDRAQQRLQLIGFDDEHSRVLIDEFQEPWINVADDARGLKNGTFIWSSEATGFRHLSLRASDGSELRTLTQGEWMIDGVIEVDEDAGWIYVNSTRGSALERRVERVSLHGGKIETLSEPGGLHGASLSRNGKWLAMVSSSLTAAPTITLVATDGSERRTLYESNISLESIEVTAPELRTFSAADGTTLYGALYRPESDGPHPLLLAVYGGPHAQTVLDAWGLTVDLRAQYLAQQGYLVLKLDNRGMAGRGLAFEAHLHRQMGTIEVDDQSAAVQQLSDEGLIDIERVGVYGWSYGGYMTVMSMLRRPDLFKVGVSGAPVSDWDGYDTGYTERYMGTPQNNAEGYREGSLLTHADKLEGQLLLIHGGVDENVHFRHTARLITALTAADRDYDLLMFPEERHMPRDQAGLEYQERRVARYFDRHLK